MRGIVVAGGMVIALLGTRVAAADATDAPPPPPTTLLPLPARPVLAPMWPDEELPPRRPLKEHVSLPRMIAGIVITSIGAAIGTAGVATTLTGNFGIGLVVLLPVGGIAMPTIGIPLWLSGSRSSYSWDDARDRLPGLPAIAAGSRSVTMGWAF